MPRPGPRPYECVRRAWHSDRHQPIRGSLIKEIFRVANEIHSSSTKQNKEWQEKLPTVVLRAEEIMYSKANSESEYMDLKTLWHRTNDAINTIIRCDESSETGQFLQPCIEAALNLGCTPRRSTRSQRNCHPRCYLSSNIPEAADRAGVNCSNLALTPRCLGSDQRSSVPEIVPQCNSSSSYPLYYGSIPQLEAICQDFVLRPLPVSDAPEPAKDYVVKNNVKSRDVSVGPDPSKVGCDLSLRLGPLTVMVPNPSGVEKEHKTLEVKGDTLPVIDKWVSFIPGVNAFDSSDSLERSAEATNMIRKRKAGFDRQAVMEDQQFCLRLKLPFRHLR